MLPEIGLFLCVLALIASCAAGGLGLLGKEREGLAAAAALQAAAIALAFAFAALILCFVRSDFSVAVVANNSHIDQPLLYKIAGAWGNHEGSILLWSLIAAAFGAAMAGKRADLAEPVWRRALGVQGLVVAGGLAYVIFFSSPFARLDPAPLHGADLNPLLQDPALAIHPPMLYAGYVGLSAPFSLAIAALIAGKTDAAWARALRPWALAAWSFLTIGITLGSYWAYYELGWGGWWFWDPVENASFMPWLASVALLHSAIVTERRGGLAAWTTLLAILAFGLSLLGAFLVRSGVLTSVHAFAVDPARGVAVLALLGVAMGAGLAIWAWRAPTLAKSAPFAPVSREGVLLLNNLGLVVACGAVLIGTLYPLAVDALTGKPLSVGPPYFDLTFAPLMAVLLLFLPVAPFLTWRVAYLNKGLRPLLAPAAIALCGAAACVVLARGKLVAALGIGLGLWLIFGSLAYVARRAGALSWAKIAALPIALWAMVVAHAGMGVFAIGAVSETAFKTERSVRLAAGESVVFAGRAITLEGVRSYESPNFDADQAVLRVRQAKRVSTMLPERRYYPFAGSPTTEVAIQSGFLGDFYVAMGEVGESQGKPDVMLRLYQNPLVNWIFAGAGLIALGGFLGLAALTRRAAKLAPAPAAAAEAKLAQ